jgi:hypothetical protein
MREQAARTPDASRGTQRPGITGMVFALRFLSHADYSKEQWKIEL